MWSLYKYTFSGEQAFLRSLEDHLDEKVLDDTNMKNIVEIIRKEFDGSTISEILSNCEGAKKTVVLMILRLLVPEILP